MDVGKHQNCNTHGGPLDSLEEAQGVGGQSAASAYLDLSRSAPAAWAGGLGVRLPAHATHEERPLFVVRTPIVNPETSGCPPCYFQSGAMPAMLADSA